MFVVPLPRGEGYANLVWQAGNSDSPFLGGNIFLAIVNLQDSRIYGFPTLDFRFFCLFHFRRKFLSFGICQNHEHADRVEADPQITTMTP